MLRWLKEEAWASFKIVAFENRRVILPREDHEARNVSRLRNKE